MRGPERLSVSPTDGRCAASLLLSSDTAASDVADDFRRKVDPGLAAHLAPDGARLIKQNRGIFDTFPLSLVSTRTLAELSAAVGLELDVQRFRPNILVEAEADEGESPEDAWVGRVLRVGAMRMRVDKRDGRCVVITIDPVTTERNPLILKTVARDRQGCVGVYGSTVEPGRVAVDDAVVIESPA